MNPRQMKTFTEEQLALYDGSDPTKPVYLGLDGIVYDVSHNKRTYGKVNQIQRRLSLVFAD